MTPTLDRPVTYDAANRWLAGRANVATKMGSREIALSKDLPPKVRAHCFFSAKVAEARVVERLRTLADSYAKGEVGLAEARTRIKTWLARETGARPDDVARAKTPPPGVSEEQWLAERGIANIASTARVNLILRQNARMAHAVGQREVSMDPDVRERWPYFRYIAVQDGQARDGHAVLHNLVLPKDHPFWATHTPPWEFNCRCSIEDADEAEAEALGGIGQAEADKRGRDGEYTVVHQGRSLSITPPESGFVFEVEEAFETCNMSRVHGIPMRAAVMDSLTSYARQNPDIRFRLIPASAALPSAPVAGDPAQAAGYITAKAAEFAKTGKFTGDGIVLGNLSGELADGLGIKVGTVGLGPGSGRWGLAHQVRGHAAELADGRFAKAISETVFSPGVRPSMEMSGKNVFLAFWNRKTGAFTALDRVGGDWRSWQVVSAHYPGDVHAELKGLLK